MSRPSKGRYSKQIFLGYDAQGKRIQTRIYSDSKKELDALAVRTRDQTSQNRRREVFYPYAVNWLSTYNKAKSKATQDAYERVVHKHTLLLHPLPLNEITRTDCQSIINDHSDAPQECKKIKTVLNMIFKCAMMDGYIDRNPADSLTLPKAQEVSRRALTPCEKESISNAELNDSDRIYMLCLLYFGLRPAEAAALQKSDFSDDAVTISKAMEYTNSNAPRIKGTKTNTIRVLPIPSAFKELNPYLDTIDDFLFTDKHGNILSKTSLRRKWNRIKNQINPDSDLHPYVFRYNYATQLYYSGITIKKAAELMGHSNTAMILKIYAQIDSEKEKVNVLKDMTFL